MSLGIGLGAFMEGMQGGMQMRDRFDQRRAAKKNRDNLAAIDTETQAAFDSAVASGEAKPDEFDQFWLKYALPKRRNEMLRQGDIAGARALQEWGESDDALKGGRLFSSAMLKAQTGDTAGAMADIIKAGQVKGYIAHGYEMVGQEDIKDQAGQVVGYRLKVKGPDGKTIEQDVAVGDVPKVIATFANPDAAWQSQQAARAEATKREQDMTDFEKKEQIKSKYDKGKATDYEKAYADAKKARMENDFGSFSDLSPEEQDAIIRKDLEAGQRYSQTRGGAAPQGLGLPQAGPAAAQPGIGGGPASPTPRPQVVVDEVTGQPVQQPQPPAQAPAPGPTQVAPGAPAPAAAQAPQQTSRTPSRDEWIADAARHMQEGGNPEYIAQRLIAAGIPPAEWPADIQRGLKAKQGATVGLGQ